MAVIRESKIQSIQARLPEIGRLFKGGPKKKVQSKRDPNKLVEVFGEDLNHFRFEPSPRTADLPDPSGSGSLADFLRRTWDASKREFGDFRAIPILLPYGGLNANFSYANKVFDGNSRCVRSCNGEVCDRYQIDVPHPRQPGRMVKRTVQGLVPCAMTDEMDECPAGCKAQGQLQMIIPALGFPGTVILTTHSGRDIRTLLSNLKAYQQFDLSKVPFRLCRTLQNCDRPGKDGEIIPGQWWFCHLEIDSQYGMLALESQQHKYLAELTGSPSTVQALPPAPRTLPAIPELYDQKDEWFQFQRELVECIHSGNARRLAQIEAATFQMVQLGIFPKSAEIRIESEVQRAREAIAASKPAIAVEAVVDPVQAAPPEPNIQEQLRKLAELVNSPWEAIEHIAQNEVKKSIKDFSEADYRKLRSYLFIWWAEMTYDESESAVKTWKSFWKSFWGNGKSGGDKEIFEGWRSFCTENWKEAKL